MPESREKRGKGDSTERRSRGTLSNAAHFDHLARATSRRTLRTSRRARRRHRNPRPAESRETIRRVCPPIAGAERPENSRRCRVYRERRCVYYDEHVLREFDARAPLSSFLPPAARFRSDGEGPSPFVAGRGGHVRILTFAAFPCPAPPWSHLAHCART